MGEELKENMLSQKIWVRFFYMFLVSIFLYTAFFVTWMTLFVQFLFALILGKPNEPLGRFGYSLSVFVSQCVRYLTFSYEEKPFPFSDWPEGQPIKTEQEASSHPGEDDPVSTGEYADNQEEYQGAAIVVPSVDDSAVKEVNKGESSCAHEENSIKVSDSLINEAETNNSLEKNETLSDSTMNDSPINDSGVQHAETPHLHTAKAQAKSVNDDASESKDTLTNSDVDVEIKGESDEHKLHEKTP